MSTPRDPRRQELADFLKSLRERAFPPTFGFAEGQRRRTAGLRREEVAQLAHISPTWYTWIEQGREVSMSVDVLDRLAIALRMERSQRAYLFELAGKRDPLAAEASSDNAPPGLQPLVHGFAGPAYVLGRHWNVLVWNEAAQILFSGWLGSDGHPNLLRYVFLDPAARQMVVDWETRGRRLVAEFRADCSTRLDEPELQQLVSELSASSPEFRHYWKLHDVQERQGGFREFLHPHYGRLAYQQMTLRLVDQDHLKLVVLLQEQQAVAGNR